MEGMCGYKQYSQMLRWRWLFEDDPDPAGKHPPLVPFVLSNHEISHSNTERRRQPSISRQIKRRREKEINARQPGRKQEATHFLALMQPIPKVIASAWAAVPGSDRLINDWCPALTPGPTFLLPDWTRYSVVKEFHLTIHLATMKMFDRENPSLV